MKGFTLLEVMITALFLFFIVFGITSVLNIGNASFPIDTNLVGLQQQVRLGMQWMTAELRGAAKDSVSISGGNLDFSNATTVSVHYYRDSGTNRLIRVAGGATRILANDITSLGFCCWHNSTCDTSCTNSTTAQISLGASKTVLGKPLAFSLSEKVGLRSSE